MRLTQWAMIAGFGLVAVTGLALLSDVVGAGAASVHTGGHVIVTQPGSSSPAQFWTPAPTTATEPEAEPETDPEAGVSAGAGVSISIGPGAPATTAPSPVTMPAPTDEPLPTIRPVAPPSGCGTCGGPAVKPQPGIMCPMVQTHACLQSLQSS